MNERSIWAVIRSDKLINAAHTLETEHTSVTCTLIYVSAIHGCDLKHLPSLIYTYELILWAWSIFGCSIPSQSKYRVGIYASSAKYKPLRFNLQPENDAQPPPPACTASCCSDVSKEP